MKGLWTSCWPQPPTFRIFMYLSHNLFTNLFSKDLFTMSPSTLKYNNIEGSSFTDFSNSWICSTKFSAVKYPTNKLPRGRFTNSPYILSEIVNKSIIFSYLQRRTFFKLKSEWGVANIIYQKLHNIQCSYINSHLTCSAMSYWILYLTFALPWR